MKKLIITVGLLLGLGVLLYGAWWGCAMYRFANMPPSVHEGSPTYQDPTAHGYPEGSANILTASSGVGLGGRARLVRFHAPLSNILAHVSGKLEPTGRSMPALGPINPSKPRLQPYGLHELAWFDIQNISTGLVVQGVEYNSMFYVDADRELYYYITTD